MEYVEELRYLSTIAKNPKTIEYLQKGINAQSVLVNGDTAQTSKIKSESVKIKSSSGYIKISNYGWDQSDKYVKIYISDLPSINTIASGNVKSKFTEKAMEVEIECLAGKSYSLVINDLLKPIVPSESNVKVKSGMVIIALKKQGTTSWDCLTGREKKLKDAREFKPDPPGKSSDDPGAGLMQMMQKMYNDGDDEMKRTLRKAWHESQEKKMKGEDPIY